MFTHALLLILAGAADHTLFHDSASCERARAEIVASRAAPQILHVACVPLEALAPPTPPNRKPARH